MKEKQGKLRIDLVPVSAIIAMARVFEFGTFKYKEWSWREVENANNEYYAALMRHLLAWRQGEEFDPESGLPHLFHILTNAAILADINHGGNMEVKKPARQIVLEMVTSQPHELTRQDLCDALNMKPAGLASVFTQLRLMGHFPMTDEVGKLYLGTEEEYRAKRSAKPKGVKSIEERRESLLKARANCENKMEKHEMADIGSRDFLVFSLEEARFALIEYDLKHLDEEAEGGISEENDEVSEEMEEE